MVALATAQHGAVSRAQLLAAGCDDRWIRRQVLEARLFSIAEGIYAVGHPRIGRRGIATAALLRAGPGSAISHISAARAWGLVSDGTDGPIHVSLAHRRGLSDVPGIVVHRPRNLRPEHVTRHRGSVVTTPERTITDRLHECDVAEITRMLEQMVTRLGRSPDSLHAWAKTLPSVRGRSKLDRALLHVVGPTLLRSELEKKFRSLCQRGGLPLPVTNTRISGWEVDAAWHEHRLAIELDSWRFHGGRWQFHRDRRKGLDISHAGYELIRLTWAQLTEEPELVITTLRAVLDRRSA